MAIPALSQLKGWEVVVRGGVGLRGVFAGNLTMTCADEMGLESSMCYDSFAEYYRGYLCAPSDVRGTVVVSCERRDEFVSGTWRFPVVATFGKAWCAISVAPKMFEVFRDAFSSIMKAPSPEELYLSIDDCASITLGRYFIWRMIRLSVPVNCGVEAAVTEGARSIRGDDEAAYRAMLGRRGERFKGVQWSRLEKSVRDGRVFGVVLDGRIVSMASITSVQCSGANIEVMTLPGDRRRGHGRASVALATMWCREHGLVPVYHVNMENVASVRLAESLGYVVKGTEVVIATDV